ncbi:hypothetical protein [Actinosynnema sp. NPDC020468]|uniref:hypothetical protein n=1 Tax=Actinosynnema sp. NPDC020468 TaxID=3154488 RepID=UPI0033F091D5
MDDPIDWPPNSAVPTTGYYLAIGTAGRYYDVTLGGRTLQAGQPFPCWPVAPRCEIRWSEHRDTPEPTPRDPAG